jgi:hypothetical protein
MNEDLLKLAEQQEEAANHDYDNNALVFLLQNGIESGTERVKTVTFYYTYVVWCHKNNIEPYAYIHFFRHLKSKNFKKTKTNRYIYYHLTSGKFDLSQEFYQEAKQEMYDQLGLENTLLRGLHFGKKRREKKQICAKKQRTE